MTLLSLHTFNNQPLLEMALTHRSVGKPNNERLEWLGDALLQQQVSVLLYQKFTAMNEGQLTIVRTHLVNGHNLANLARRIGLPSHLHFGRAVPQPERDSNHLLANAMEAYLAAIYLDGGHVGDILDQLLAEDMTAIQQKIQTGGIDALRDAKSRLQEQLQRDGQPLPTYRLLKTVGGAHQRTFWIECRATADCLAQASGTSRSAAELAAAAQCLEQL